MIDARKYLRVLHETGRVSVVYMFSMNLCEGETWLVTIPLFTGTHAECTKEWHRLARSEFLS